MCPQERFENASGESRAKGGYKSAFDNFFSSQRPMFSLSEKVWNPPTDVYETSDSIVVKMEIAGLSLDEMKVMTDDHYLIVQGCRREEAGLPKDNYHLMEIHYGYFERVFGMPGKLHSEDIEAQYNNGFLVVTIGKRERPRRNIDVKVVEH
ncbi:MAG: Hsp20/alpha crystallin family protein [Candidatus Sumerlaeota bacterium]